MFCLKKLKWLILNKNCIFISNQNLRLFELLINMSSFGTNSSDLQHDLPFVVDIQNYLNPKDEVYNELVAFFEKSFNFVKLVELQTLCETQQIELNALNKLLQTYEEKQEQEIKVDPMEGDELFIENIDLLEEYVTIRNPTKSSLELEGYHISDEGDKNKFSFTSSDSIHPNGVIYFYCSVKNKDLSTLRQPAVIWKNKDQSNRMKNVLNDLGDTVRLYNPDKKLISSCEKNKDMCLISKFF